MKTLIPMCLILSLNSCKKEESNSNDSLPEKEKIELVASAKKLYEMNVKDSSTSRFAVV